MKRIGCLGPKATFSHEAVVAKEGKDVQPIFFKSFGRLVQGLVSQEIDEAAIPVTNLESGGTSGREVIMLNNGTVKVVSELVLPVRHHLIAASDTDLTDITIVMSKMEALGQCQEWFEANIPDAEQKEASSSAAAVESLNQNAIGIVAVGSELAAREYDKKILVRNIQDRADNATHFLFIARENNNKITGKDKTSLVFGLKNEHGSLYNAIAPFAVLDISMGKIVSMDSKRNLRDVIFWVDIEGHKEEPKIQVALEQFRKRTEFLHILGSYPRVI